MDTRGAMVPPEPFTPGRDGAYAPHPTGSYMQTLSQDDPALEPRRPGSPKGYGGNTTIINQYEWSIGPQAWGGNPFEETDQYSLTGDFDYVQGGGVVPSSPSEEDLWPGGL